MLLPIYQNGLAHDTVAQRRAALVGWVDAVLRIEELMEGVLGADDPEIDIEIFDGKTLSKSFLLYDKDKFLRTSKATQLFQATATQLVLLKNAECDFAQGYFFSKPVPAAEFEALLDVKPVGIT